MFQQISYSIAVAALLLPGCLAICGCQRAPSKPEETVSKNDDLQAEEILRASLQQYAVARSYQDRAVLYLTYRLNGRAIHEPHPWSIAWDHSGLFSADLFNAQIRCDGQRLSCYVFDIETGNLDNQQLLVPAAGTVPLGKLFQDSIAAHFIFGKSELPLHEPGNNATAEDQPWVQPMIGLFDSKYSAAWLNRPDKVVRMDDDDSTGRDCHVVRCTHQQRSYRIWIDREFGMIDQIEFPLDHLDSAILASQEITDLRFFARFHDATLNPKISPQLTEVKLKLAAKPVSRFVTLPQSMASTRIGEIVELDAFAAPAGHPFDGGSPAGKTTAMLWLVGDQLLQQVEQLAAVQARFADRPVECLGVYGDEFLSETAGGSFELPQSVRQLFDRHAVSAIHDRQLAASTAVGLKVLPAMMVIDAKGIIQFAKGIDTEDWAEQLEVAITRTLDGDQLADEMKEQYQEFLDDYHRQLVLARSTGTEGSAGAGSTLPMFEQHAELQWTIDSLQDPGNILIPADSDRILVIDGWRSIVELDFSGNIIATHRLQLPDGVAINRIRSLVDADGVAVHAVFSLLGKQAFVFDTNWQPITSIPHNERELAHKGITECQLADLDQNGKPELLVSFLDQNGLKKFELTGDRQKQMFDQAVKSFALTSQGIALISDGALYIDSKRQAKQLNEWKIDVLVANPFDSTGCIAIGRTDNDRWQVLTLDAAAGIKRADDIGSQFFDSEIDSVAVSGSGQNGSILAVASVEESLAVMNSDEVAPRLFRLNTKLTGIGAKAMKNGLFFAFAAERQISLWKMAEPTNKTVPVSGPREIPAGKR